MQNGYNVSAVADPEIPPETWDRMMIIGKLGKEFDLLWERYKHSERCGGEQCVSQEDWQAMAKKYKEAGMDWLPRPLAAKVGEGSYHTILTYQDLPDDIDEIALKIIQERGCIKPDHLAGLLKVTSSTVGRIIGRLKDKNLISMDRKGRRLIMIKENTKENTDEDDETDC